MGRACIRLLQGNRRSVRVPYERGQLAFAKASQTKSAPAWVAVLHAAREWGKPPYEIAGGSVVLWQFRWTAYNEVLSG